MPRWTPQSRALQAEKIRSWSPWEKSTGPQSVEGKTRSSRNAKLKGDRLLQHVDRELKAILKSLRM